MITGNASRLLVCGDVTVQWLGKIRDSRGRDH